MFAAFSTGMARFDFHSRTNQLVALKFLQRRAHVSEAIGEKERGREQERKKKEFHEEATSNAERSTSNVERKEEEMAE